MTTELSSRTAICKISAPRKGYFKEFSAPYTPQQNGVAERNNRTLIETARTMLVDSQLPVKFWNEVVATACYTMNRVLTVKKHGKTCYELLHNRKPNLHFLEPFGSPCTVLDPEGKFGSKVIEGYFIGYASPKKRCLYQVLDAFWNGYMSIIRNTRFHQKALVKPGCLIMTRCLNLSTCR